ncbi:PIG-L deacetylase family protein [Brasilonema sp. UFV-L1]|uniref:PIG-L deacetylase family protein n=1 Tax=Brasilonema sp. UFV-L1 TaxID=2234130 RepID=UPI00145CF27B|nr:PIG-L deacetylase family protein [Brasilonema sp. UFV-L1]NMG05389.1 PIG-L family deacetylase [Brasilonema sp. UFV-L1]
MLKFSFEETSDLTYKVLCLGAHCDDIEIGCGGTILKLVESYPNINFYWVVFSSNTQREKEAYNSANKFLEKVQDKKILIQQFQDGFFPFMGSEIKQSFEQLKRNYNPDIIFTHSRHDLHQDHRLISDLTWNTFRNHLILEYEIPKYDGDLGNPNLFVHLNEEIYQEKVKYILDSFPSQNSKQWFTEETFLSILRLRGMESNAPNKYAEAFYCRKVVF